MYNTQDIQNILETKSHNPHYLNRYVTFIYSCIERNRVSPPGYIEKHHILPKCKDMFPNFSSFKSHPWNCANLSFRQHFLAHWMLMKAYNTRSQMLSVLRTAGQCHSLSKINTRLIEAAKIRLSLAMAGVFTRGYDSHGRPNVSQKTKTKLSKLKTQFYSDPANREAQSKRCTGIKKTKTYNQKIAAQNRSETHQQNMSSAIRAAWATKKLTGSTKRIKDGVYVTPIGNFTSIAEYRSYCKNPDKPFTAHNTKKNPKLNSNVIGLTPRDLGFFFIPKTDPIFEQYCVGLNQEHLPEPNHLLLSELNDFLSHKKLQCQP